MDGTLVFVSLVDTGKFFSEGTFLHSKVQFQIGVALIYVPASGNA